MPRSSPKRRMSQTSPTALHTFSSVSRWTFINSSSRRLTSSGSVKRSIRKLSMRRRKVPHSKRLHPQTIISARSVDARSSSARARSCSQKPASPAWSQGLCTKAAQRILDMASGKRVIGVRVAVEKRETASGRRTTRWRACARGLPRPGRGQSMSRPPAARGETRRGTGRPVRRRG